MPKLMLVEDDNNLREIYEARLQAEGYDIVAAKDGEEALVLAKAEKPDLIISDVMMPKISGFEMLDILRNTEGLKQVKVIMLTALGQNDDQKLASRLGTDRYLVKSQVTLEDIVKVTHELLGDQQASPEAVPAAAAPAAPETPPAPQPAPTPQTTPDPTPPVAPPAPDPVPAAPPVAAPPDTAISDTAQSTVQEEASVDGKIEDFVAGATEEPTPTSPLTPETPAESVTSPAEPVIEPTPAPTPPPLPPAAPDPTPDPVPAAPPAIVSPTVTDDDDKLVSDAAQKLVASTEEATPPAANPPKATDKPSDDEDRRTKKIIQPIDTGPKQDLDTLLALEEAKEASTTPAPPATPIVVADRGEHAAAAPENTVIQPQPAEDTPSGAPASSAKPVVTTPNDPADPNNIAL